MKRWLITRGQSTEMPMPKMDMSMPGMSNMNTGDGMCSADAYARHAHASADGGLRNAKGKEFDRLFLEGMIQHHGGALTMVKDLYERPVRVRMRNYLRSRRTSTAASGPRSGSCSQCSISSNRGKTMDRLPKVMFRLIVLSIFAFAAVAAFSQTPSPTPAGPPPDPFAPQSAPPLPAGMTGSNTSDPRFKLTPGLYNAGETAMGLKHLNFLKKPDAFQLGTSDPNDPRVGKTLTGVLGVPDPSKMGPGTRMVLSQLAFANSDMAFQGKHLFQGNFYGISIYDISDPAKAKLLTTMVCPGGQGDVSVYKNLMFMSVEMDNGRVDCGTQFFPVSTTGPAAEKDRFRGVRIFDISDIQHPKQVAAIQTCRGSHTHTLVLDPNDPANVYIYVSETSHLRSNDELAGCSGDIKNPDANSPFFKIDVIKVPIKNPEQAKIVTSPRIFMDPNNGGVAGISSAATHGECTRRQRQDTQNGERQDAARGHWLS